MALAKTIVATGATSGLGFEVVKQLLSQTPPYKFILGARDTKTTQAAYDALKYDAAKHSVTILPLELSDLRGVRTFTQKALETLAEEKLDYLFLNAAIMDGSPAGDVGPHGSKWSAPYIVNHLSQHYMIHLLRPKLTASHSRIVVVSSGAVRNVRNQDPSTLDVDLKAGSGADALKTIYPASKFVQLLAAHYWRRELKECIVVAVSPGLIPHTGLSRTAGFTEEQFQAFLKMPDAKSVSEGAESLLRAFTRDDMPVDPEQILLTSWGEWWSKDVYALSLDKQLQAKWTPSKEDIEKEEGLDD